MLLIHPLYSWPIALVLLALALVPPPALAQPAETSQGDPAAFEAGLALLTERSFSKKEQAIDRLVESGDPRVEKILKALMAGDLHVHKADDAIVYAEREGGDYRIVSVATDEDLGTVGRREVSKITVNNQMRSKIRAAQAALDLTHPEAGVRLAAVEQMMGDLDEAGARILRQRLDKEEAGSVREAIAAALALHELADPDPSVRRAAVLTLQDRLEPEVRARLATVAAGDASEEVRVAAAQALEAVEFRVKLYRLLETLFFGLSAGSILVLAAFGLAITFGVMGVINMAHGELIMLGAYTTWVIQQALPGYTDVSIFLAIPAAFVVAGAVGILIERSVIRFLYGRPLETLLATFGISLILQQAVRTLFSPLNRSVETPSWMSGSVEINSVLSLTLNRLYILAFSLIVFAALYWVLKRTRLGLQVRAVSQNRAMARAMGVRSGWVDAMTFGLGSGIAGIAGVALSQITNVGPNLGQAYIIDSFMVVVFGGVGNLWGTLIAGLSLGVVNKSLEPWSGTVLATILVLVFIILFIQKRPRGLFPQKGRAAET